jgi:hypothetical protein
MLRVALTIVLPLLLPTAIYLLWMRLANPPETGAETRWGAMPWIWLAGAGAALLVLVLVTVTVHFGSQQQGVYVPPRWEGGHVVPPHIEPKPN